MQHTLHTLLADRRLLPQGGTLAFPCTHLYHQDARFQRQQRPLSKRTVSALEGRDSMVAATALAAGLGVPFRMGFAASPGAPSWLWPSLWG